MDAFIYIKMEDNSKAKFGAAFSSKESHSLTLTYLIAEKYFKRIYINLYINSLKKSRYGLILGFFLSGEYTISRREMLGDRGTLSGL